MDQHLNTNDSLDIYRVLEGQLRECYGRVVYSHKTQEKCVDILLNKQSIIKISQIILSALTTGGLLVAVIGDDKKGAIFSVLISTILLVLNAYTKNYNLGEIAQKHKQAANDLWIIREKYLSLLVDVRIKQLPIETVQSHRDKLLDELHMVYSGSPSTTGKAYQKAQNALQQLEDMTFSDAEIDKFLPKELKRANQEQ